MINQTGQSVIELLLAAAIFVIIATGAITIVLQGLSSNRLGTEYTIGSQFATEGIEAARSIRNQSFSNLINSAGTGVVRNGSSVWSFSGTNNIFDKYTRTLTVSDVQRDASGNIVLSGGTTDPLTKKITSTTSWNFTTARSESLPLTTYLTRWRDKKGGLLVYGDGGTTTDAVKYRIFDASTNTWGVATTAFDVDGTTTNKALRALKIYSSTTRNEKISLSRHYNGSAQFIYATIWNGTSWGTPLQLSTWTANTFLDVQNFDGTYLNDGTFMVVYSDNTIIPKYRIWNGTVWSAQSSLTTLGAGQIPNFIVASARPGTNEVMAAFLTQGSNSLTQYWNGTWSAITNHSTQAPSNAKRLIDFKWSTAIPTEGIFAYTDSNIARDITARLWTANGTGSGSWSVATSTDSQSNNLGSIAIAMRPTSTEAQICEKDTAATPNIYCYGADTTNGWLNPNNQQIASATDVGIQRSFDLDFESVTGDPAIMVYSDNTTALKFKKYNAATSTWDAAPTTIPTVGFTPGVIKSVRLIPQDQGDDMAAFFTDANLDLYSVFWNGTSNTFYTSPAGLITSQHGINGSATTDFWYDFGWDRY